ncbi:MAG: AAA family ATPase [Candidatus Eremiobacteraeota bacterium]|nr:AAA family ATPase [Candidatus Eremiobacteraeota bacterium]MBV8366825.1 AAA family ATPase [Candidatus Eremiobacteraeota bacterium]
MESRSAKASRYIDRKAQLQSLESWLAAAVAGRGQTVAVSAEGGAGKSRLLYEFVRGAKTRGARTAVGHCLEYIQSPFAPFLAALSALIADSPRVLTGVDPTTATLAHLIPELEAPGAANTRADVDKLRVFTAFVDALTRFSAERPVILVVEDLHWADDGTLELLQHVSTNIEGSRVLVVVSFRAEDVRHRNRLRSVIAKLERHVSFHKISLGPLADADMHELVADAAGDEAEHPALSAARISAISAQSEGNPLFAEELLRTALESSGDTALPSTLREAVLERFATLDQPARRIITTAAAFGRTFEPEFLARITDESVDEVIAALKGAFDLFLIVEERGSGRFAFRHELTRAAIYNELLEAESHRLHAKIAAALEQSQSAHDAELAFHWWQAGQRDRAATYYERAGDTALEVFAYRDALTAYERALEHGSFEGARGAELELKLAAALHQCGMQERAVRATEAALAYYETDGDRERAAGVCLQLAWLRGGYGDSTVALELARKALALVGDDPASTAYFDAHVMLMQMFSEFRWEPNRFNEEAALAQRASGTRSIASQVTFLGLSGFAAVGCGELERAVALTDQAVALALANNESRAAVRWRASLAMVASDAGENAVAQKAFAAAMELLQSRRIEGLTGAWIVLSLARAELFAGNLARAREFIGRALAQGIETPIFGVWVARTAIPLGLALADTALVKRCARKHVVDVALSASVPAAIAAAAVFAEHLEAQGHPVEARALLARALDALDKIDARAGPGDIEACMCTVARIGDEAQIGAARAHLQRTASASHVRSTPAMLALFDAHVATRSGDRAEAHRQASQAASAFNQIGWPLYEAQSLELLGRLKQAKELYIRTGDIRDAQRVDALLNPVNRRGRAKGDLTAREREICDLLVQGKSNKAIAEQLVLSERTVESHVSSVLTKVGASTRAELIAKLK